MWGLAPRWPNWTGTQMWTGQGEEVMRTRMRYFGSRGMRKGSCPEVCDQLSAEVMTR